MEKVIKLYISEVAFPDANTQIEVSDFTYNANRMGNAPTISFNCYYGTCIDSEWTNEVYAEFNGEKFFLKGTPVSSYSNKDARYIYEVTLISERVILEETLFFDIANLDSSDFKPVTNSSQVYFYGTISEFKDKLNNALKSANLDYVAVVDDEIVSEAKQITFKDKYFADVLKDAYNAFDIPYYFVGKTIHFGYADNEIETTFKYGIEDSLLSIKKTNAYKRIINRIAGVGSTDNIPYYYPNMSEKGDVVAEYYHSLNGDLIENAVKITNAQKYIQKIKEEGSIYYRDNIGVADYVSNSFKVNLNGGSLSSYSDNQPKTCKPYDKVGFYRDIEVTKEDNFFIPITANVRNTQNIFYGNISEIKLTKQGGTDEYNCDVVPNGIQTTQLPEGTYSLSFMLTMPYLGDSEESFNLQLTMGIQPLGEKGWFYENGDNKIRYELQDIGLKWIEDITPILDSVIIQKVKEDSYIIPQQNLMPPVYRETKGAERFYKALNNTYPLGDSYYVFENPYIQGKQKEHIETFDDIKPTIKEIVNANGLRIDMFSEFAYDADDNDETEEIDGNLRYKHPYFFGKLRKFDGEFGFNLFDHTIDEGEMTISMTTGSCGGCNFIIGVDSETQKNLVQVDENGNLLRDSNGNVRCGREGLQKETPQDTQNDTENNEVWIALKKDIYSFGVIMPNATNDYKPKGEDTFVILHIDLPQSYILNAEKELEDALIKYMHDNNAEKFNFSIDFSRIYLEEHQDILNKLTENSKIKVVYNDVLYDIFVSSFSYKMSSEAPLPEISLELSDELKIVATTLDNKIDVAKKEVINTINPIQNKTSKAISKTQSKKQYSTIQDIVTTYQSSYSGAMPPDGEWMSFPNAQKGMYLWSRVEIRLQDNTTMFYYNVSYQGVDATGDIATPIFYGVISDSISPFHLKWDSYNVGVPVQSIVYLSEYKLFASKISDTEYRIKFDLGNGTTYADYQDVYVDEETQEVSIHKDKTFVKLNTNELYVFNDTMGLTQVNNAIIIK